MNPKNSHQWPLWWRIAILFNISFYNLVSNAFAAGITPLFGPLFAEMHMTTAQGGHLASYALLALGLSNLLALPCSALISKRYFILISQLIFIASNIWAARATSYESLLGTRIVGGLAGGAIEALGPVYIVETFRERALSRASVVYVAMLAMGGGFGPLFSGIIATNMHSWRWFFWIMAIVTGVNFLSCVLMLPETSDQFTLEYAPDAQPDVQQAAFDEKAHGEAVAAAEENELAMEISIERPDWYQVWREYSFYIPTPTKNKRRIFRAVWNMVVIFFMPPVTCVVLIYGVSIGWTVVIGILTAATFQSPPYLWSSQAMGVFGISSIVGIILGIPVGGNLSDYLSQRSARRNDGVHHAESRLPALIMPFIVSPLGVLITGIYLHRNQIWFPEAAGLAMLAFGTTSAATTMLSYAVDSFPHRSGEIGLLVNLVKNVIGFGLSYGAVSWSQEQGVLHQFYTMAGLLWAIYLPTIPLYFYGSRLRAWAAAKVKI